MLLFTIGFHCPCCSWGQLSKIPCCCYHWSQSSPGHISQSFCCAQILTTLVFCQQMVCLAWAIQAGLLAHCTASCSWHRLSWFWHHQFNISTDTSMLWCASGVLLHQRIRRTKSFDYLSLPCCPSQIKRLHENSYSLVICDPMCSRLPS